MNRFYTVKETQAGEHVAGVTMSAEMAQKVAGLLRAESARIAETARAGDFSDWGIGNALGDMAFALAWIAKRHEQ